MSQKPNILRKAVSGNIAIILILIGVALVSFSIGPFQNPDTAWEYKAATGVIRWGMPFVEVQGSLINQPPLGFYAEGLFLRTFGVSIETGTVLITLFGLGCTLLVYVLAKTLYGRKTGILAAALFSLTPWQFVLSSSFLIDTQSLFLSLCALYVGILAFRSDSNKLLLISGTLFALAFFTKFFSLFMLIPLALFYIQSQRNKPRKLPVKLALFILPLVLAMMVWYTVDYYMMPSYLPKGLGYLFNHSDFSDFNTSGVVPTYSFVTTFLFNYGLGYFFIASAILSLLIGLVWRKQIGKQTLTADYIFLVTILLVLGLTLYLGVNFNLKVPYTSTIKYAYQTLPLFSLVAASLAPKCLTIIQSVKAAPKLKRTAFTLLGLGGLLLIFLALLVNINALHELSTMRFIIFEVELGKLLGYSFDNFHAVAPNSPLMFIQYAGFALVLSALVYSSKRFFAV